MDNKDNTKINRAQIVESDNINNIVYSGCTCCKPIDFMSYYNKKHYIDIDLIGDKIGFHPDIKDEPQKQKVFRSWNNSYQQTTIKKINGINEE
jgi:hypothetical protein